MSAAHVLFAVHGPRALAEERLRAVEEFYAPCGVERTWVGWHEPLSLLVGAVELRAFDAPAAPSPGSAAASPPGAPPDTDVWTFGERPPPQLRSAAAVLGASDDALRALDGFHAIVAVAGDRARIVGGAGAPRTWFAADGDGVRAWATHGAAATLLAHGGGEVDPQALPMLLALGSMLDDRTHLRGVRALPIAAVIELRPGGCDERGFWPRDERWAHVPERRVEAALRGALLDTLDRRLRAEPAPWLALTGGRDSPVVAAAAHHLGLSLSTFTWGEEDWADVEGGRSVASAFGLPHRHQPLTAPASEADARAQALREAVWSDGAAPLGGYGMPTLPDRMSAMVTGAGAEVGRGYYYNWAARSRPRPRPDDMLEVLGPLDRVPEHARGSVRVAMLDWFEGAAAVGHSGWTALDVFYTEQRMGRWGRSQVGRHQAPVVTPFPSPEVSRALVSLPLADRMTLAWHRRFVGEVAPTVVLPDHRDQRRGVPPPLRRAASALRRRREPHPGSQRWFAADAWERFPGLRDWILDEPLRSPLLESALGPAWLASLRDGLAHERAGPTDAALLAAAAAVVDQRLRAAAKS